MNRLFHLLYWSTFCTKRLCCWQEKGPSDVISGCFSPVSSSEKQASRLTSFGTDSAAPAPRGEEAELRRSPEETLRPSPKEEALPLTKGPMDSGITYTFPAAGGDHESRSLTAFAFVGCFFLFFFLFQGREGERQGSCTKAGNIEEEMKMSGAGVTDVRTGELERSVPCKPFPSILAIFGLVMPCREMHKPAFPFSGDLFGIQHTYLSKCCVCHAVPR